MIKKRTRFKTSWLIERDGGGPREVLTLGTELDEKTLPVFSFEEEALLFLRLSGLGCGWRVGENKPADLVSLLADPCSDTRRVALDPIPEIGLYGSHDLVCLSRDVFVGLLADE